MIAIISVLDAVIQQPMILFNVFTAKDSIVFHVNGRDPKDIEYLQNIKFFHGICGQTISLKTKILINAPSIPQ